jgi:hypothetical protein
MVADLRMADSLSTSAYVPQVGPAMAAGIKSCSGERPKYDPSNRTIPVFVGELACAIPQCLEPCHW